MTGRASSPALTQAAAERRLSAESRVKDALRMLDNDGAQITFASLAAAANVSRQYLYSHPQLRAEIEQLRGEQRLSAARLPARERASDDSIRARLRAALEDNRRLREESARLRDELAIAYGRVRELEAARRTGTST